MDPLSILAILGPLAVELGKAAIGKVFGQADFKPVNINDWATMQDKQIAMFTAINSAGGGNPSYPFVEAIIRLQRPFVVLAVTIAWTTAQFMDLSDGANNTISNLASSVWFYLFGDRTLVRIKSQIAETKGVKNGTGNG